MPLAEGWVETTLGTVVYLEMGQSPSGSATNKNGVGLPLIGGAADYEGSELKPSRFTSEPSKISQPGDLVLCIRATIGNIAEAHEEYCLGRGVAGIRPVSVEKNWIRFFIESQKQKLNEAGTGTTFRQIDKTTLTNWPTLIAPLNEQRRIVAKLEAVLAKVQSAQAHLDKISSILKRTRQAILSAAVSGKLTVDWREEYGVNIEDWKSSTVLDVANVIFDGPFGSHLKSEDYQNEGVRVIRLENIAHLNFIRSKETFISTEKYMSLVKHTLQEDDILFSSFVDEQIRVCLFPGDLDSPAINKADCFCIRVNSSNCIPLYLTYRLACVETYIVLREAVHGATRPRINLGQLKSYSFSLPTLEEQQEIVWRVEALFERLERIEAVYQTAKEKVDTITQETLSKAFRGELVPQDPNDEPANILLERIKAERLQQASQPKTKRMPKKGKVFVEQVKDSFQVSDEVRDMVEQKVKDLLEVLKNSSKGLSPEALLREAGYGNDTDSIEAFYKALKQYADSQQVQEEKQPDRKVLLSAVIHENR